MRRHYELNIKDYNDKDITLSLRLQIKPVKRLEKKYNAPIYSIVMGAIADTDKMTEVFTAALGWDENNVIKDGDELYDLLVDNGYEDSTDFGLLLTAIGNASGVIKDAQKKRLDAFIKGTLDSELDEIVGKEEAEGPFEKND